jgi:TetR/AcrR family transcriptional repressor of bet genes
MPKRGVSGVRREQICMAAASVIAEEGFSEATMRHIAERAGVSTGMLNHYFKNRMDMLRATLTYVSRRVQARSIDVTSKVDPGEPRLRALIHSLMPTTRETEETWKVWIAAYSASINDTELRDIMASRAQLWHAILLDIVDGLAPAGRRLQLPAAWELNALLDGYVIQALAVGAGPDFPQIEDLIVARMLTYSRKKTT